MPVSRFPQRLRELRTELGLVQDDIARIAGVSARGITSNWEKGKRTPDVEMQLRLADFFGVSLDYLHGRPHALRDSPAVMAGKTALHRELSTTQVSAPVTPGELLSHVYAILQRVAPGAFSPERVAAHLLITPPALEAVVEAGGPVSEEVITRFANLTGLPVEWFFDPSPDLIACSASTDAIPDASDGV